MKKLFPLLLSLLMILTLMVACEGNSPSEASGTSPSESATEALSTTPTTPATEAPATGTTTTETPSQTTPTETTNPQEDPKEPDAGLNAESFLDMILQGNESEPLTHFSLKSVTQLELSADMNGITTHMTLTGGMVLTQANREAMQLVWNLPTQEPYSFTYVDRTLYVSTPEGKVCCPLSEDELTQAMGDMLGELLPLAPLPDGEADNGLLEGIPSETPSLFPAMSLFSFFKLVTMVEDIDTGDVTVTLTGVSTEAQFFMNMLLAMLEKAGATDGETPVLPGLLEAIDTDSLTLSLTADKTGAFKSSAMSVTMDTTGLPSPTEYMPSAMTMTVTTHLDRGEQKVSVPEDAADYRVTDWHGILGIETPEMLGLIPDEHQVVTLSEEPELFARQYDYLRQHPQDFEGVTLAVTAHSYSFEKREDGSVKGLIHQVREDGSAAEYPYVSIVIPASMATDMAIPADGSVIQLTGTLVPEEGYYQLRPLSYKLISGPTAVG